MSGKSSGTQSARCAFREQASEFIATVQNRNGSSSRRRTEELFRMNSLPSSSGDSRQQRSFGALGSPGLPAVSRNRCISSRVCCSTANAEVASRWLVAAQRLRVPSTAVHFVRSGAMPFAEMVCGSSGSTSKTAFSLACKTKCSARNSSIM